MMFAAAFDAIAVKASNPIGECYCFGACLVRCVSELL